MDAKSEDMEICTNADGAVEVDEDGFVEVRCKQTGEIAKMLYRDCVDISNSTAEGATNGTDARGRVIQMWGEQETKMLMFLYADNIDDIGAKKPFYTKKALWEYIARKVNEEFGSSFSPAQVEGRYKTILKRTKRPFELTPRRTKIVRATAHDSEPEKVDVDEYILPEVMISPGVLRKKRRTSSESSNASMPSCSSNVFHRCITVPSTNTSAVNDATVTPVTPPESKELPEKQATWEYYFTKQREMFEIKERNHQRRHEEKMKVLQSFVDVLKQFLER